MMQYRSELAGRQICCTFLLKKIKTLIAKQPSLKDEQRLRIDISLKNIIHMVNRDTKRLLAVKKMQIKVLFPPDHRCNLKGRR